MVFESTPLLTAIVAVILAAAKVLVQKWLSPTVDAREPPLVPPRIPVIGHIVSMIREKAGFYTRLFTDNALPICTLPMLGGKLYVINSPALISSAMRNADLSFEPFRTEFSQGTFGINDKCVDIISRKELIKEMVDVVHAKLTGPALSQLSLTALERLMQPLNGVKPGASLLVPDSFLFVRDHMTEASTRALFGAKNPITAEHVHLLWTFDDRATVLALNVLPSLIARESLIARTELQKVITPYFQAKLDQEPDVSEIIRERGRIFRREGYTDEELGVQEITLPWVGTTNTVPALFWMFVHLFTMPEYVVRVRDEVKAVAALTANSSGEGRVAVIEVSKLETHCPVLNACYQESLRLYLLNPGNRRVMKDTVLQDSDSGREYLLKQGVNVQWSPGVTHYLDSVWGEGSAKFNPERFLSPTAQDDKQRRGAMLPFGGGRYLCPGRKLAVSEILGFIGVLALGFEVEGLRLPKQEYGTSPVRPSWDGTDPSFKLSRRTGWEDVVWKFVQ